MPHVLPRPAEPATYVRRCRMTDRLGELCTAEALSPDAKDVAICGRHAGEVLALIREANDAATTAAVTVPRELIEQGGPKLMDAVLANAQAKETP